MRASILGLALLSTGCARQITFVDELEIPVTTEPPALETPVKTDIITQVTTPEVDILWVIDNSGSMAEEQQKLANNFPEFMRFFLDSGLDWHIGVVSTDTDGNNGGRLQGQGGYKYLTPDSPNPIELFQQMATLGTGGSSDERGRRAAYQALTDPLVSNANCQNPPGDCFYRENASLHVVVISDEQDSSNSDPTRNEFVNFLQSLKADPENVTFSGIVGPVGGCATAVPGTEYHAVIEAVGGVNESICQDDWAPVLEQLGLQAAGLRREYFLSDVPVEGTVQVRVEDQGYIYDGIDVALLGGGVSIRDLCETDSCFQYEYSPLRNSITMLDFVPSPLAKIQISYELLEGFQPEL